MSKEAIKMADVQFKRDMHKYLVMKQSDIGELNHIQVEVLQQIINQHEINRSEREAGMLECVVVESDWPIYDQVWQLVEQEATGKAKSAPESLIPAIRQYQHNDGSGLVFGYDRDTTDQIVDTLTQQRDALAEALRGLVGHYDSMYDPGIADSRCTIDDVLKKARAALKLGEGL